MDARDLELSRPCPIDLDRLGVDRDQPQVYCSHCRATVTDISRMREVEAAAFVAANRGRGVCISYLRDAAGDVRFADSPPRRPAEAPIVPLARLRRAAAAAALGLAACTPHGAPGVDRSDEDELVSVRSEPAIPYAPEPPPAPPDEAPCQPVEDDVPVADDAPVGATPPAAEAPPRKTRGTLRKTPPTWDRIDGGI